MKSVEKRHAILLYYAHIPLFQGEKFGRQAQQVETLLKTIYLLTDIPVTVFILNNDQEVFNRTQQDLKAWSVDTESWLRFILLLGFVLITSVSLGYGV